MNTILILFLLLAFVSGQFARVQLGNGVTLLGIDVVVGAISILWFLQKMIQNRVISSPLTKPLGIFSVVAVLSLVVNATWLSLSEILISSLYLLRFLAYAGLYFFFRELNLSERKLFDKALFFMITGVVIGGLLQHASYQNLGNLYYLGWDDHLYRLFSVYLDPNFTGSILVLFFLYLGQYISRIRTFSFIKKLLFFTLMYSIVLSIFVTYSRTALLMLIGGGVVYLFLMNRRKIILAFFGVLTLLFLLTIDTTVEGLNPFRVVSTKARIESYDIATRIFFEHPIFGVGFNAYRYAQNEYGYRVSEKWETSHADAGTDNSFLFVLATTGIIGFSAYLYLWVQILEIVRRRFKEGSELSVVAFSSVVSVFVGSFFINLLFYPFIMAWVWVLVAQTENNKSKKAG